MLGVNHPYEIDFKQSASGALKISMPSLNSPLVFTADRLLH